jgi:hypothetical protein
VATRLDSQYAVVMQAFAQHQGAARVDLQHVVAMQADAHNAVVMQADDLEVTQVEARQQLKAQDHKAWQEAGAV